MVGLGVGSSRVARSRSFRRAAQNAGADQLAVHLARRLHGEQANNGFPARIHPLFDEVSQALGNNCQRCWVSCSGSRQKLVEHGVKPICRTPEQISDSASTGSSWSRRVVRRSGYDSAASEFNPVGELRLETHLLAGPDHRLATIESKASMVSSNRSRRSTPRRLRRAVIGALGAGGELALALITLVIPNPGAEEASQFRTGRTECIAFSCTWDGCVRFVLDQECRGCADSRRSMEQ